MQLIQVGSIFLTARSNIMAQSGGELFSDRRIATHKKEASQQNSVKASVCPKPEENEPRCDDRERERERGRGRET